jgi:hypothetical protein
MVPSTREDAGAGGGGHTVCLRSLGPVSGGIGEPAYEQRAEMPQCSGMSLEFWSGWSVGRRVEPGEIRRIRVRIRVMPRCGSSGAAGKLCS